MKKSSIMVVASILLGVLSGRTAVAADAIMGVNIRGYGTASERQQDDLIEQLHKSGVTTIRESLPTNIDERFTRFVTHAYKAGIGIVVILYPTQGGTGKHTSPVDPAVGRKWRVPALSDADPEGFR
jgi:hypothetical protein